MRKRVYKVEKQNDGYWVTGTSKFFPNKAEKLFQQEYEKFQNLILLTRKYVGANSGLEKKLHKQLFEFLEQEWIKNKLSSK